MLSLCLRDAGLNKGRSILKIDGDKSVQDLKEMCHEELSKVVLEYEGTVAVVVFRAEPPFLKSRAGGGGGGRSGVFKCHR